VAARPAFGVRRPRQAAVQGKLPRRAEVTPGPGGAITEINPDGTPDVTPEITPDGTPDGTPDRTPARWARITVRQPGRRLILA